jgi:hypothetical protein
MTDSELHRYSTSLTNAIEQKITILSFRLDVVVETALHPAGSGFCTFRVADRNQRHFGKCNLKHSDFSCGAEWIHRFGLSESLRLASWCNHTTAWPVHCGWSLHSAVSTRSRTDSTVLGQCLKRDGVITRTVRWRPRTSEKPLCRKRIRMLCS